MNELNLWAGDALFQWLIWVNPGSGDGLLPDSNRPLLEPVLHQ